MSEYELGEAIDRIVDLTKEAKDLKSVKQVYDLPTGEKGILLEDGTYTVVGTATKDALGNRLAADPRISRSLTIQTVDSLVDYIQRFRTEGTTLFADISTSTIHAVLDYHVSPEKTGHSQHIARLKLPFSFEWELWGAQNEKLMTQLEFARFIEENGADIKAPSGADLLEAIRDLQAKRSVNFIAAVSTSSDNESFEYSDKTDTVTKGGIEVPKRFLLNLPVYFGSRDVDLYAFLRNRVDDGKLSLGVKLNRAEQVRQAMFREIVTDLADRADAPVIYAPFTASS